MTHDIDPLVGPHIACFSCSSVVGSAMSDSVAKAEEMFVERWKEWESRPGGAETVGVALISTGSFSPVHRMHVAALDAARRRVEEEGVAVDGTNMAAKVIAGFLSPSHDSYVSGKLGVDALDGETRVAMISAALEDGGGELEWMAPDDWEAKQDSFVDFPAVALSLKSRIVTAMEEAGLGEAVEAGRVWVAYVCGADHAAKCNVKYMSMKGLGVVVTPRPSAMDRLLRRYSDKDFTSWCLLVRDHQVEAAVESLGADPTASSTEVRSTILTLHDPTSSENAKDDAIARLSQLVFPSVQHMLLDLVPP